jgi:hypothetical protein
VSEANDKPVFRVVRGEPTAAELAALTAVLAARATAGAAETATRASSWSAPAARLRVPLHPGAGAWSAAARVPGARTRADW